MATIQATIPDELKRELETMARSRGLPLQLLVELVLSQAVNTPRWDYPTEEEMRREWADSREQSWDGG